MTGPIQQSPTVQPVRRGTPTTPIGDPQPQSQRTQTDQLQVQNAPTATPLSSVVAAAKAQNQQLIGNTIVDGARALHTRGYVYPPDLGPSYSHQYSPDGKSVGCCADFVADSYKEMAKSLNKPEYDIGAQMEAKGYNPHYCPSMIQYFQKEQTLLPSPAEGTRCHVGDAVFFNWDGSGKADPSHVAVVTKVDDQGRPLELMESRSLNHPSEVTTIRPGDGRYESIVAIGRLKDATSDDEAANKLPPLGPSSAPGDAPSGGTGARDYSGGGRGNGGTVANGPSTDIPSRSGTPTNYQPFHKGEWMQGLSDTFGVSLGIIQELANAIANGGDMSVDALAAEAMKKDPKLTPEKAKALATKMLERKADLRKAAPASGDTAKYLGKMSANQIEKVLVDRHSPLAGKHMGEFILQMEQKYGVPAAQFLAQATMESGLGKTGYTQGSHYNIGNLRPGSSWTGPTVSGSAGSFRSYGSPEEGIEDYFKLLGGGTYKGKSLHDQIFTYAPPSENNSQHYLDQVQSMMTKWTGV